MSTQRIGRILAVTLALAFAVYGQPHDKLLVAIAQGDRQLQIFKVEGTTLTLLKKVPAGAAREVCISTDGRLAYSSNDKDNNVTVVDLESLQATATIALPGLERPDGCATSPDSKKLYVAASESETVAIISTQTNKVIKQVKVGKEPRRVVFSPDKTLIYVSSEVSDEITILNAATDTVIGKMKSGGQGPRTMVFLPDNKTMLVTNVDDDTVSLLTAAEKKVTLTIGAGGSPQRLALSADAQTAYVLAVLESKISMIDLKGPHIRAKTFMPVGKAPWGMTMSDDHKLLFVGSSGENTVTAYDTATMKAVAKVTMNHPTGIAFRP